MGCVCVLICLFVRTLSAFSLARKSSSERKTLKASYSPSASTHTTLSL